MKKVATTDKRSQIAFELPEALKKQIKIAAITQEISIHDLMIRAITEYLNKTI